MSLDPTGIVVDRLDRVDQAERDRWRGALGAAAHAKAMASITALHQIEVAGTPAGGATRDGCKVVAWNLERGTHVDAAVEVLRRLEPDVVLSSELDVGMARSGNRHTAATIAESLGHGYAYAVEFVELGLGDAAEVERLEPDASNERGFHGNAITARWPLADPILIRIEDDGSWFSVDTDQPRVGGRMAIAARIDVDGAPLVVCSLHLESQSDPDLRAAQLTIVLQAIDAHYGAVACVVGGDLNTFSASIVEAQARFREMRADDPTRFCWPVPFEPLFEIARSHGFEVDAANPAEQTTRLSAHQRPGSLIRLDWLLVRGLAMTDRATIPALDTTGAVISDHDAVMAIVHHA